MPTAAIVIVPPDLTEHTGLLDGLADWTGPAENPRLRLDASLLHRVIRKRLSVSTTQAIASCPSRWAVESLLPRSEDPFGAAELGTATHQVFQDLFALVPAERTLLSARELLKGLAERHPDLPSPSHSEIEAMGRWRQEIDRRMVGLWDIEDPAEVEVVATEQKLETNVAGVPFIGYIDRVSQGANGHRLLVDYKAGLAKVPNLRYGDKHGEQLRVYSLALAAATDHILPGAAFVYYVAHGKFRKVSLARNQLARSRDGLVTAWERMHGFAETAEFPTGVSSLCGWCPLAQVCPAAAAAGKAEPRSPTAMIGPVLGIVPAAPVLIAVGGGTQAPPEVDPLRAEAVRRPLEGLETTERPVRGPEISGGTKMRHEDKSWVENDQEGNLNFNSYAAMAAFGLAELAVETLHDAGAQVTAITVQAMATTFATLVARVQKQMDARLNMQDGLHSRLRGALRTCLRTIPPPFGGDDPAWDDWAAATGRRLGSIATVAERTWLAESDPDGRPWASLATIRPLAAAS